MKKYISLLIYRGGKNYEKNMETGNYSCDDRTSGGNDNKQ